MKKVFFFTGSINSFLKRLVGKWSRPENCNITSRPSFTILSSNSNPLDFSLILSFSLSLKCLFMFSFALSLRQFFIAKRSRFYQSFNQSMFIRLSNLNWSSNRWRLLNPVGKPFADILWTCLYLYFLFCHFYNCPCCAAEQK